MIEESQTAPAEPADIVETPVADERPEAPEPPATPDERPVQRSRREAIEAALGKAVDGSDTAEKPATEEGQPRTPDGKFAPKDGEPAKPEAKPEAVKVEDANKPGISDAPTRFSDDAKAAWKDAPESVRGEIRRAINELEAGIRQKDEMLAPLQPYFEMAKKHDVRVHEVLGNYINMENLLRENPAQGFSVLARRLGMTPQDIVSVFTGEQSQATDKDRQIAELINHVESLQAQIGQISNSVRASESNETLRQVQEFAADKPRFAELEGEILKLIETGYASDLSDAYAKAELLKPAPQTAAPPPQEQRPPQTRQTLSVTGAPGAGSNPARRPASTTRSEAIMNGLQSAGLA